MKHFKGFEADLLHWYHENKRSLPWRDTTDPYAIWLSEIIMQQTRIDQGLAYFNRFIKNYPTIEDLATASEDEVLKSWQGLGYYSRARNLHETANFIVTRYNGKFPADYKSLLQLKGVGEYTASAIASIAFGLPFAAVDGNVYRVLSRIFGIDIPINSTEGKKTFRDLASNLLNSEYPGDHNQALMEFGATQCTPKNPDCPNCIFNAQCFAIQKQLVTELPVKKGRIKTRHRYFNYLIISTGESLLLQKRTSNDIWRNLYEFPMIETTEKTEIDQFLHKDHPLFDTNLDLITEITQWSKQLLSHQLIHYRFIQIQPKHKKNTLIDLIEVNKKDIFNFAVPKPIEQKLEQLKWF